MSTTIQDIAKVARVSRSTVSVSLASSGTRSGTRVSETTKSRIKAVARQLGYQPNMMAKGLAGGRTSTIGILWSLGGPHRADSMAQSISLKSHRHGYTTQMINHLSDPAVTIKSLGEFKRRGVDGVVMQDLGCQLETPQIIELLNKFPAAIVIGTDVWKAPVDHIHHDRISACREVADHFAAAGRRRPAIIGNTGPNDAKIRAFMECAARNSMDVTSGSLIAIPQSSNHQIAESYRRALEERFGTDGAFEFDALFCLTDEGAVVVIDWLRKRGLRVPRDVAVVGFNNSEIDAYLDPPLASIERRDEQVADAIDEIIFTRLMHPDLSPQKRYVSMQFAWRESAGRRRDTE